MPTKAKVMKPTSVRPLNRKELGEHVAKLISNERNKTHGDPHHQFMCTQTLKYEAARFRSVTLSDVQQEAIDMILVKVSRVLCGGPLQDHFLDIAGYALIAAEGADMPLTMEDE